VITYDDIRRVQIEQVKQAMSNPDRAHCLEDYGVDSSVREHVQEIDQRLGTDIADPWCAGLIIGLQLGRESL
jgi:hypothetical protein